MRPRKHEPASELRDAAPDELQNGSQTYHDDVVVLHLGFPTQPES
jgi:hypothetical protein